MPVESRLGSSSHPAAWLHVLSLIMPRKRRAGELIRAQPVGQSFGNPAGQEYMGAVDGVVAAAAGQFLVVAPLSGDNSPFSRLKVEKRRPTTCRMEKRRPTTRRVEVKCAAAISASGAERWMPLLHFVFATRPGSCIRIPRCLPYNMTIRIIHRGRRATRPPDAVGEEPAWRRSATCSMTSSISPRA